MAVPITLRATAVILGVLAALWLAYSIRDVLVLAFLALIVAAAMGGPVALIQRRLPRLAAIAAVYAGLILLVTLTLAIVVPPLVSELAALASSLPSIAQDVTDRVRPVLERYGLLDGGGVVDLILQQAGNMGGLVSQVPFAVAGFLAGLATVTALSAIMLVERERAETWGMRFIHPDARDGLRDLLGKAAARLGAYVRGQLAIMTVTGVASGLGLVLIGVPYALPLGLLAFVTEAIPLAGPIVAGGVMILVALFESPVQALFTFLLVLAIQQLEGLVLVPVIQGRVISISPVVAIVAILAGSSLYGILGALIAIPVVALGTIAIDDVVLPWRRRHLGAAHE